MNTPDIVALRARWILPVSGPPIAHGTVSIAEGHIVAVGPAAENCRPIDLGNVAILPGLVNAHTHLEFSDLAAPLGQPGIGLADWIRLVMAHPRGAASAVETGLRESFLLGTTTLVDIAQKTGDWSIFRREDTGFEENRRPKTWTCPLPLQSEITVLLELIAPTIERVEAAVERARQHLAAAGGAVRVGLSPHAPYSVHPELLRQAVLLSAEQHVPLAMHLAESREEIEFLRTGGGPLAALLESLGAWDPTALRPGAGPGEYLRMLAHADRALVVHGNYLGAEEIEFLAAQRQRMSVVYCPRTHAWFRHAPYPLEQMLAAGVRVALGTDSRASSPDLSLLAEMRAVARRHPSLDPAVVLELGTLAGAETLGRGDEIGSLSPGKWANLAVVGLDDGPGDGPAADPYGPLLGTDLPVVATYIHGERV